MNRKIQKKIKRHLRFMQRNVVFQERDFYKVQNMGDDVPPSGNWGGVPICVEVAKRDGQVAVRDSKDKSGPVLRFSYVEWEAFLYGAKRGQFDV